MAMALLFSVSGFSQDSTMKESKAMHKMMLDGYLIKGGKVWAVKNGEKSELTKDVVLDNGSTLMPDATLKDKDGTITTLREGDWVMADGTVKNKADKVKKEAAM